MADERYWTYQSATKTPTHAEALALGAIRSDMTEQQWHSLTPGMRREIVRSHVKREARKVES